MGWCSATDIFDATIKAAIAVLNEIHDQYADHFNRHEMLLKIARQLKDKLEAGDWDCQQESDYYQDLKWDLWPELEQDYINDLKEYPWEGAEYEDREGILHRYSELAKAFYHPFSIKCNDPDCVDYGGDND